MAHYVEASFKLVNGKGKETFTIDGETWERDVDTSALPPAGFIDFEDGTWTQVVGKSDYTKEKIGGKAKYSEHSDGYNAFDPAGFKFLDLDGLFGGLLGFGGPGELSQDTLKSMIDDVADAIGLNDEELDDISQSVKTLVDKVRDSESSKVKTFDFETAPKAYQYEDIECDCEDCLEDYCDCDECLEEEEDYNDEYLENDQNDNVTTKYEDRKFTGILSRCPKCDGNGKQGIKYVPASIDREEYFQRVCTYCGFNYTESISR